MATQRYISTSFWTDKWIRSLDPSERYLYMYLLTNPETNIAGVYKVTMDRIAFDTGYDERTLRPMFDRFAKAGKAHFVDDEWIVLPTWPKHQRFSERDNVRKGIDALLLALPDRIWNMLPQLQYQYVFSKDLPRSFEDHARTSNYSDSDSDSDTDTDSDTDGGAPPYGEIVDHLNTRLKASYKSKTRLTRDAIKARWREGFRLADFKMVIDWKAQRWENDPKMFAFLRPSTLFGPKFEGYLNEIPPAIRADMEKDYGAA